MSDELAKRVDALSRGRKHNKQRIDDLEAENEELRERLEKLEMVVKPDPARSDWKNLTHEDKVLQIRKLLAEQAGANGGSAAMGYNEIRAAFDYKPSVGAAYNLMDSAATIDGFELDERTGQKRLTVKLADVNDDAGFHRLNKPPEAKPA